MRKLGAAMLALPVVILVYLSSLGRRGLGSRIVAGIAASAVIGLVVVVSLPPAPSAAIPRSQPQPVDAGLLDAVRTGHGLTDPFILAFDAPMDPASVAAAFRVAPESSVRFGWDADGRVLTIRPVGHWVPDTLYTITVSEVARSADGGVLRAPVRALVLTGHAGTGMLAATRSANGRALLDTAFRIVLDRDADLAAVQAALRTEPALEGAVVAGASRREFMFKAAADLAPDSGYHLWLDGLADLDGVPFAIAPDLEIRTVTAPSVVRFRPRAGTTAVERGATISVRFSERMDRKPTASALSVTVAGTAITGKVTWAEQDTVLVFRPAAALPYGAKVVVAVNETASSRTGVALTRVRQGTFQVVPKPAPTPAVAVARKTSSPTPVTHSAGTGAVSGTWTAVETYYLRLMNCTRTGGWVTSTGACSSPGGRNVAPIALSSTITSRVSRPYAKLLATRGICSHFADGDLAYRLRRGGIAYRTAGENLGCRSGNPYSAVLASHLFFQSEKPYNGGHYRNLMNASFTRAGIGVWVSGGRVRLTVDFIQP